MTLTDDDTPSANLDVDGNGRVDLFSDIILIIRYVLFFREEALTDRERLCQTATRTTHQDIESYIDTLVDQKILDVDGKWRGGAVLGYNPDHSIRPLLPGTRPSLRSCNLFEHATRTTHQDIEPYIRSLYPDSHFQ